MNVTRPLLIALLSAGTLCQADVILSLTPSSQTVVVGSPASLEIDISGLGNGTALGTYDLTLGFDPTLLSYTSIAFGNQLDLSGTGDIQSVTPGTGTVEVFELSLDSPGSLITLQASTFVLATLNFDTLATGNSPLTLSINAMGDEYGNSFAATIQNGSMIIGSAPPPPSVPEPSSSFMVVAGLITLAAAAFRHPVAFFASATRAAYWAGF